MRNLSSIIDLEVKSSRVISVMKKIDEISHLRVGDLHKIPLGFLKEGTYGMHGVCRFKRDTGSPTSPSDVRRIDIHPLLLTERWSRYADHVLYHEYLHALTPESKHGPEFRKLEALWPDEGANAMGDGFRDFIRERRADILVWELLCHNCGKRYLRKKPVMGGRCGKCKTTLENIKR